MDSIEMNKITALEEENMKLRNEINEMKGHIFDLDKKNDIIKNEIRDNITNNMVFNSNKIIDMIKFEIRDHVNKNISFDLNKINDTISDAITSEIKYHVNKNIIFDLDKVNEIITNEIKQNVSNRLNYNSEKENINDTDNIRYLIKKDILDLTTVQELVKEEKLDICVISYGGSCSNQLVDVLHANGYNVRTPLWDKLLCHCPEYIELDIPIIYIYGNPINSFLSVKRRNPYWIENQKKLSNNLDIKLSDENLLKLMIRQFNIWSNVKKKNVLILKSSEIFEINIVNKLESFLNNKNLQNFPVKYKNPITDIKNLSKEEIVLFNKYKKEVNSIIQQFLYDK